MILTQCLIVTRLYLLRSCQDATSHREFKRMCGPSILQYMPESSSMIVLATHESTVKKAALLSDMHMRSLHQKMLLKQKTVEISRKLEVTYGARDERCG